MSCILIGTVSIFTHTNSVYKTFHLEELCNHLTEEERAGCYTLIMLLLSCVAFSFLCLFLAVLRVGLWSVIIAYLVLDKLLYTP